jgi:hypothetical protein
MHYTKGKGFSSRPNKQGYGENEKTLDEEQDYIGRDEEAFFQALHGTHHVVIAPLRVVGTCAHQMFTHERLIEKIVWPHASTAFEHFRHFPQKLTALIQVVQGGGRRLFRIDSRDSFVQTKRKLVLDNGPAAENGQEEA